jgi:ELWxxDGT repeat protein
MRKLSPFLLLLVCLRVSAQVPYLVKDVNTSTAEIGSPSLSPQHFCRLGSRIVFSGRPRTVSAKLVSSDGTAAGTRVIEGPLYPTGFRELGGKALFSALDADLGVELWSTDGTAAGTRILANIAETGSSRPEPGVIYRNRLIFSAADAVNGRELWITDGTTNGTRLLKDIEAGRSSSSPENFVVFNDAVYFNADFSLWKTDGTESGTVQVAAVWPQKLVAAGQHLFFIGNDGSGLRLWMSDGTAGGTHQVTQSSPPGILSQSVIAPFGDRILFTASDSVHGFELWISDGTEQGTRLVRDIRPGPFSSFPASSFGVTPAIAVIGNVAIFDASEESAGHELWRTDGTEAGTMLVRDIVPNEASSDPATLTAAGDKIFFSAVSRGRRTLWVTDGSPAGTREVGPGIFVPLSVYNTANSPAPVAFNVIDGVLYFPGADFLNGYEPWKSDGTESGTSMIANLSADDAPSSEPRNLVAADGWIYFDAWDGNQTPDGYPSSDVRSLWRSDGTDEGTVRLSDGESSGGQAVGRSLLFYKKPTFTIWRTDGTPQGTAPADLKQRIPWFYRVESVLGSTLFVSDDAGISATSLADGSPVSPLGISDPRSFVELAGRAMILTRAELWSSDGTAAGTHSVLRFDPDGNAYEGAVVAGTYYFMNGMELWKSDGTADGTVIVKILPRTAGGLVPSGHRLFFLVEGELWVSDGTEAGTIALLAIPSDRRVFAAGNGVVFAVSDPAHGRELWASDGTVNGTRLIRDIAPGSTGSFLSGLTPVAGLAFFSANDGVHGAEMWVTDGTAAGTRMVIDLEPGPVDSNPANFVESGERVFFTATTGPSGTELWALPLTTAPRMSIADARVAEGDSGTTAARFAVTLSRASQQTVTVDYATSPQSAQAGSDYDTTAGRLTFAPGETAKIIEVPVRGDVESETNETFLVTLGNPAGATLGDAEAFAIIEEDDQVADVALSFDRSAGHYVVTNHGPQIATDVRILRTLTPARGVPNCSYQCPRFQLKPGETQKDDSTDTEGTQQQSYFSITATGRQRDPQPSNNTLVRTSLGRLTMDALYLTPGSQANLGLYTIGLGSPVNVNVESSEPAIVAVPATVAIPPGSDSVDFVVRGLLIGTSTIRVLSPTSGQIGTLSVSVLDPGATPRWPGAIEFSVPSPTVKFGTPMIFNILRYSTAPRTGAVATGIVKLSIGSQELGSVTLSGTGTRQVPILLPAIGGQSVRIDYLGDSNFLPQSMTYPVFVNRAPITILGWAVRSGAATTLKLRLEGSPAASPTGSISISGPGFASPVNAPLADAGNGVAAAEVTLANLEVGDTLAISYAGDTKYLSAVQNVRVTEERTRAVRH